MTIVAPSAADAAATLTVPFVRALMDDWARRLRSTLGYFGDDIPDFHDVTAGRWAVSPRSLARLVGGVRQL